MARIGVQVADALAYAHAQGVLHRDVKPSNLLLDAQGTAWVTDFGVAKLVEEANLTQSGDLVGTLRYMPPERFLGLSDARGDVYSLGITLYELLAHRPAFPDATPHHLIQMITQADPPPLRKLDPSIPTDLETVILKAVARDPAHRYQSATELADDLRRFLDDRPVLARRAGSVSLLWRWCRRNRVVASLSAAALSLLVLTSAVAVTAYLRTSAANRDKEAANAELKKALAAEQEQRGRAERTSASALQAMNRIYDRFAPNRLIATPRLPADGTNEEGGELPAQPVLPAEAVPLLEELLGFYEQLARDGSESPHLRLQAAEADQRIGDIRQRLGQPEQAVAAYRLALDLYSRPAAEAPDEGVRIKVARTYNELGRALRALQRPDEARQAHSQALATLADAPSEVAARPECQYELARTYYFQAEREVREGGPGPGRDRGPGPGGAKRPHPHHHGLDDFGPPPFPDRGGPPHHHGGPPGGPGSPPCDQAIALLEVLVKEHPAVPEYRHLLACCYRDAPPDRGPPGANAERALDLLRQLVKDCPKVPDYRYDLCETLARAGYSGQPLSAGEVAPHRQMLDDAITLSGALAAEYPNVPLYAATRALAHERLGALLARMSKPEEAERPFRKAVALQGALVRQHPEVAAYRVTLSMMQSALAGILTQRGDLKEAEKLLEEATQRLEAVLAKEPQLRPARRLLASGSRQRAEVLSRLGQTEKAAEARRKAEALGPERKFGPPGPGRRPE